MCVIVLFGGWLRCLGTGVLPPGQFTSTDAYLYAHQAETVWQSGALPARDLRRWVPVGRDNTALLSAYAYLIGYAGRLLPGVSLYTVQVYIGVVAWSLGVCVLMLFLQRTHGWGVALCVGLLLTTLPGSIERSAAGFGDRDAFCWLMGVLGVVSSLVAARVCQAGRGYLLSVVSGGVVLIGGLSWEGFCFFLFAVHGVSVYEIATTEASVESLKRYVLWVLSWVPMLYLLSPAYRQGQGWATHLFAVGLLPPVGLLGILSLRCLLRHVYPALGRYDRKVGLCLVGGGVLCGGVYLLRGGGSFATTAFPFADSPLLSSIGELAAPPFGYWVYRYGSVFVTGSLGLSLMPVVR